MKYLVAVVLVSACAPVTPILQEISPIPPKIAPIVSRCNCSWAPEGEIAKNIFKIGWSKKNLNQELVPVAWNESYYNTHLDHEESKNGPYQTAFGPLGLKPSTAHLEWKASPKLQKEYPGLETPSAFLRLFQTSVSFYNRLANNHWARLKTIAQGDLLKAAFGWRYGPGFIADVTPEQLVAELYIQKYTERAMAVGIEVNWPENL